MKFKQITAPLLAALALLTAAACATKPPANQFGFGPRLSEQKLYSATIDAPAKPLAARRMMSLQVSIRDAAGNPVDGAQIEIDGGMPQHGHGLPTKPVVTRQLGNGDYQVEGMKFNMGGWWVVKFRVNATPGSDSLVFNVKL